MVFKNKYSTENRFSEYLTLPVDMWIPTELHILENIPEDRQFPNKFLFFFLLVRRNKCSLLLINRFVQFLSQILLVIIGIPGICFKIRTDILARNVFIYSSGQHLFIWSTTLCCSLPQAIIFHIVAYLIKSLQILCIGFILYFVFPKGMLSIISLTMPKINKSLQLATVCRNAVYF